MSNSVKEVLCIDVREIVTFAAKTIGSAFNRKEKEIVPELTLKVETIINDIITRLTHWSDIESDICTDKYIPQYNPKDTTVDGFNTVYDEMNRIIFRLESELNDSTAFPTWGYPTVKMIDGNVIIVVAGDYRIDDWMKQNQKRLKKSSNVLKLVKDEDV